MPKVEESETTVKPKWKGLEVKVLLVKVLSRHSYESNAKGVGALVVVSVGRF